MATSPIYSWPEPDNTDLVKNGALAIRTLGDAIDTTMATMTPKSTFTAKGSIAAATAASTPANLAVGANGTSLVADSTTTTGLAYSPNGLTQPIINGAFDIAQRGTTTGTMSTTYIVDRWAASTSSGVGTQAQVTGLTVNTEVFRYAWKFTALGSFSFMQMGQQIELANCYQLQNQQVTISFYAQANNSNAASTALTVRTRTAAGVDASCLFTGTANNTSITLTTTPTRYTITKTLPATFGALSLEFVLNTAGIAGDGFTITGVQIDKGSVALPFRRAGGTIQGELAACQRYYFRTSSSSTYSLHSWAMGTATTQVQTSLSLPVQMRTLGSVDFSNVGIFRSAGLLMAVTSATIDTTSDTQNPTLNLIGAGGLTTDVFYRVLNNNSATGYLAISGEL